MEVNLIHFSVLKHIRTKNGLRLLAQNILWTFKKRAPEAR